MATPVLMPRQGQSVESCLIVNWLKNAGDSVSEGDPLCEVETDKAVFEVPAPASGTLIETFYEVDADVPVLTNIAAVGEPGEDVSDLRPDGAGAAQAAAAPADAGAAGSGQPREPEQTSAANAAAAAAPSAGAGGPVSPRARNLAADKGVDTAGLNGSGPHGRIIERDVQAAAAGGAAMSATARAGSAGKSAPAQGSGPGGMVLASDLLDAVPASAGAESAPGQAAADADATTEIPVKGIRKVIAQRMHESLQNSAQLTLNAWAPASAIQRWRQQAKAQQEALGLPKISINDLVLFAVSRVLKRYPSLNAHWMGDKVVQHSAVHLGVAVDTERGLMVPVIPHAQARSVAGISGQVKALAKACQDSSIAPDKLSGSTFTVTNLGAMGITHFTPVLNLPEVAILGVGAIELRPVRAEDGSVTFAEQMALSLTIDHRSVDGSPAAKFLADLANSLAHIDVLLAQ